VVIASTAVMASLVVAALETKVRCCRKCSAALAAASPEAASGQEPAAHAG
jgi:hypothetical protein